VSRAQIAAVLAVVVVAIALIVVTGSRVMARDRRTIQVELAQARMQRLGDAATELANDVEKIDDDLELALTLGRSTQDARLVERDFRAIAAIAREYVVLELRTAAGDTAVRVEAPSVHPDQRTRLNQIIEETVRAACQRPQELQMSEELRDLPSLRVFARTGVDGADLVVAVVVDMQPMLAKLQLLRGADSALLVLGPRGGQFSISDPRITREVREPGRLPRFASFLHALRARLPTTEILDRDEAVALGLPEAAAVAVGIPVSVQGSDPWTLALVASTVTLRTQERTIVRRMIAAMGLLGAILLVLVGYVLQASRRSAALHERLRHADRMAHLTEKAEKILDHIPSCVLALSGEGRVTAINARLRGRISHGLGRPLEDVFASAPAGEIRTLVALVEEARRDSAVRSMHAEDWSLFGDRGRYNLYVVPLERRLPDVDVLVVAEDLSDVQRLEGQLLHSEKLATLGVLAAGIAHEIGTPLNIARGWAERGQSQLTAGDPQAEIHGLVMEQIDHVTALIGQLLDFVRPRAVAVQPVDAASAIAGVVALLGAEAQRRGMSLTSDVEDSLPPILADAGQLQQVLVNLVMNAFDACERGGHVAVRAHRAEREGWLRLEIVDDGCGIARAMRNQIFDPFFTTKKRGRGTGLGLTVVDQLVRSHAAQIEVDSEPGRGTMVRIVWPSAVHPEEAVS
jgi:two-component system, NtrC family, sensor histidine kinase HydH